MEFDESTLARMVDAVNKHLPKRSKTLAELLNERYPTITARDGNEYLIEKKELEFISRYVDDPEDFKIPIILEMCDVGGSTLVYVRDKRHAEFIKRAFGFDRFVNDVLVLHLHEMSPIRGKLRTASQVFFRVL